MKVFGLLGLVIALAIGAYLYTKSAKDAATAVGGTGSPKMSIDLRGVNTDLVTFATAEKQEFALDGKYATIEDMRSKGTNLPADHRGPFTYTSEVSDTGFKITATYGGEPLAGIPKTMSIDETMRIQQQ